MVTTTTPGGMCVSICTCRGTGRHLATFTRRPGSSMYTLATEPPQVVASAQVSASGQVAASCSSLPPLPPSSAPPCLSCVEGQQRAALHSSSFPLRTAPLQTLHMDFSVLLWDFCRGEGILQSFTLPNSPQQDGIAERRIGLVMEVARTSMIHAAAPHFLWPFAGSRAFVHNMSADKLSAHTIPYVFLGFVPDAPGWQFYHPRVLPSKDVMFDESVPFYRLFPYRSAPPQPPPLFLAPAPPPVDPLPPRGLAPSGVYPVDPLPSTAPVQEAVGSGAAPGAAYGGAASGGADLGGAGSEGAGSWGAEPEGVERGGAELGGSESGGAAPRGGASSGGRAGASPRLSLQQLREWLVWHAHRRSGAPRAGGARDTGAGGAVVTAGAGGTGGTSATRVRILKEGMTELM
ncbi:unnamed protein product [Closterium sp. NIES-54]